MTPKRDVLSIQAPPPHGLKPLDKRPTLFGPERC